MKTDAETRVLIKETVRETLLNLGFNIDDPEEMVEHQKDKHFVRAARLRKESLENKAWHHGIGMVISAVGAAIILGVVTFFRGNQ